MTTYPYEYTKKVYAGIPFTVKLRKDRYWDSTETYIYNGAPILTQMWAYNPLNMSYLQLSTSLMTVSIASGRLPNNSTCASTLGCLATVGQGTKYTNYVTEGSPTIDINTGEVTDFSSSNYLKLPTAFNPTNNSWEIRFKFKTNSTISTNQKFFHSCSGTGSSGRFGIGAQIYNSKFNMFVSSNGSSWLLDEVGTYTPLANTTYWVKVGWTGTEYYFEYSTDGETYTRDITYSSTSPICTMANSYIGIYSTTSFEGPWLGTIYLADCQITIDNSVWWTPATTGDYYKVLKYVYTNYTTAGTPTIDIDTGEVSNFSNSNYLYENFGLSSADSWEINTAFMVTSNTSARRQVISSMASTGGVYAGVSFLLDANNYIVMQLGLTTSSYDNITTSFTVSPNTKYYLKGTFDGSTYEFKYSTDGETYTSVGTISSTAKIYQSIVTRIGVYGNAVSEPLTNGTIYLADTNISVNGSEYWTPKEAGETIAVGLLPSGVVDDGTEKTWNMFYNYSTETFLLDTTATKSGYVWVGDITIPAHTV